MSWTARITEALAEMKQHGLDFTTAWKRALEIHPPPRAAYGPECPTLDDLAEETLVEFQMRITREAWDGTGAVIPRDLLEPAEAGVERRPKGRTLRHGMGGG